MRLGFGLIGLLVTAIVLVIVGAIAYNIGWSDGVATHLPANTVAGDGAPYYYGPHYWGGGFGFGLFGIFWFLLILFGRSGCSASPSSALECADGWAVADGAARAAGATALAAARSPSKSGRRSGTRSSMASSPRRARRRHRHLRLIPAPFRFDVYT